MHCAVEHLGLAAADPETLKAWYVRVLDAREVFNDGNQPPAFMLELPGGLWVEIYPAGSWTRDTGNNRLAGWRHLALRVDSLEEARTHLRSRGVAFDEPVRPAGGGGRVLFFKDAEDNLLHLVERPHGSL